MRILLQHIPSGRFLDEDGRWTSQQARAKSFEHFLDALVFARDCVAEPVGAYCVFQDPSCNFSVYLRDKSAAMEWETKMTPIRAREQAGFEEQSWAV